MTLLDYIKKYPDCFFEAIKFRASSTPSSTNRRNHVRLAEAIKDEDWDTVGLVINLPEYQKPLDGVVCCLEYGNIDKDIHVEIYCLWKGIEL